MATMTSPAAAPFVLTDRLTLRNRIVGTAHGAGLVANGLAQPADAEYWRRRAAGGAAMLIVGGTVTAPESTWRRRITSEAWRDEAVPGMALRAEAIRSEGAIAACQLVHLGRETTGAEMWFHPVAPSSLRSPREPTRPRALTDGEIDAVIEGFRVSARHAALAGFQVIELHAAHGYLLAQFLSRASNVRPGAEHVEERVGIVARIIEAIRAGTPDVVVGVRISAEGGEEAGQTLDGICELLPLLGAAADYVNVTVGVRTTYVKDMATEEPPLLAQVARLRAHTDRPLLVSQGFRRPEQLERALAAGADLIGMARPLIADPDLPAKVLSDRGREVRPCVSCNEDCRAFDPVLMCSVNPELSPPGTDRRPASPLLRTALAAHPGAAAGLGDGPVAIVGAGPAGLECAFSLATLHHRDVVLFDERPVIGGQLAIGAAAPGRHGWRALLDFYADALADAATVELQLGTIATPAALEPFAEVVIAVGATETLPELPGVARAMSASQTIATGPAALSPRSHVVIADDGFGYWPCVSSVEVALAAGAERVTVLTPGAGFATTLPPEGRAQLLARLKGTPLTVHAFTAISSIGEHSVQARNTMSGELTEVSADAVIVVGERRARPWDHLDVPSATVRVIGDALVPRKVAHAIAEGRAAAADLIAEVPAGPTLAALA